MDERRAFVSAIQCLSTRPSKLYKYAYPGALNQFLDFPQIRVANSLTVLLSGFSLSWHRYFLWLFEQTLRHECNFEASLPYWDFGQLTDLDNATMFDGSDTSLSGNGGDIDTKGPVVLGPNFEIPAGSGGACVSQGPFANFNTTIIPIDSNFIISGEPLPLLALESNPNCLTRNFNNYVLQSYCNTTVIAEASAAEDIEELNVWFNGVVGASYLGLSTGIGFAIGGNMESVASAAQDPLFFLAWTMLDRIYASWQALHPSQANDQWGTETSQNMPPSKNVSVNTILPGWNYLEPDSITVADVMNTTGGVLCYEYDSLILPS